MRKILGFVLSLATCLSLSAADATPPTIVLPTHVNPQLQSQIALILGEFNLATVVGPVGKVKPATTKIRGEILSVLASQNLIPATTPGIGTIPNDTFRVEVLFTLQEFGVLNAANGSTVVGGGGLAPGSVTAGSIADGAVTSGNIAPGAVVTVGLADGSVTTPKLANNAVTAAKVGSEQASAGMALIADGAGNANWAAVGGAAGSITLNTDASLTGGGAVPLGGSTTLKLSATGVAAGGYTLANLTIDAQGRVTAASSTATVPSANLPIAGTTPATRGAVYADNVTILAAADGKLTAVASAPSGAAGGDLAGTYPNPSVAKINGSTVPAGGALTPGNVLQVTGGSALAYGPLNLAGGLNFLTGVLPIGNGGTGANTAAGALTSLGAAASGVNSDITGLNGLNTQNAISVGPFGAGSGDTGEVRFLGLAPSANYVGFKAPDAIPGVQIWTLPATDGTNGQVLTTNGLGLLSFGDASTGVTLAGDVTGAAGANQIANSAGTDIVTAINNGLTVGTIGVLNGGTGASTAAAALSNLGGASLTAANTFTNANSFTGATTLSGGASVTGATEINTGGAAATDIGTLAATGAVTLGSGLNNVVVNSSTWGVTNAGVATFGGLTSTGAVNLAGAILQGPAPLVFEGATVNAFQTTLAVTDPTASNTITLPNASGTVALLTAGVIPIAQGGTGASTAAGALTNLGAAASGVNSDITGLNGLNTQNAISVGPFGTNSGDTGELRFLGLAVNGANYVGFKAPDAVPGSSKIWTLPFADGTNGEVLTTNGFGVLSFGSATTGVTLGGDVTGPAGANTIASTAGNDIVAAINNGLTAGIIGVINGGTGASSATGARANLMAAESGANTDITSLSGLLTALPINEGGTGATSAAAALLNLGGVSLSAANTFTNANTFNPGATDVVPLAVRQTSAGGSSNDVLDVTDTTGVLKYLNVNSAGNTSMSGSLSVAGASTLTGNAALGGTLIVTGDVTLNGAGTGLTVANNEAVGGTLGVTGATTLSNTLAVTGATTINTGGTAATTIGNATPATTVAITSGSAWSVTGAGVFTTTGSLSATGAGTITSAGLLTGNGGLTAAGATNINTAGAAVTNIGTGAATGAVTVGGGLDNVAVNSSTWKISNAGVASGFTGLTSTGQVTLTGAILQGASPLVFEGATVNGNQTTLAVTDPTAARTITLPDASGTVALLTGGFVPVAQGGTGLGAGTSGGILGFTAAGTIASSGLLTANGIVLGGGAGATPTSLGVGATGTVLVGNTGAAPSFTATPSVTSITTTGAAAIGTTLGVTGAATLSGGAAISGVTTINGGASATATTIGNAASTTTITGPTNINTAGTAATTIGSAVAGGGGNVAIKAAPGNTIVLTAPAGNISATSLDNTPIGATTAAAGSFTALTATGAANINTAGAAVTNIGTGAASGAITIGNAAGGAITLAAPANKISATSLDSTPIGPTTASTGRFTTLTATTAASGFVLGAGANATTFSSGALAAQAISFPNASGTVALLTGGFVPVAQGGTGLGAGTSGGILGFTAAGTIASSGLLTANGIVLGGGAGATPTSLGVGATGTVLVGNTGAAPSFTATPSVTSITTTGAAAIGTTLGVTGAATLSGGAAISGVTTINGGASATATTIGNAASTTTITGPTNINTAGTAATTIGSAVAGGGGNVAIKAAPGNTIVLTAPAGNISATSLDNTPIGATTAAAGSFTALTATGAANINTAGAAVTNIGTGAASGAITIGNAAGGAITLAAPANKISATSLDSTPIGPTTASTGRFTTLTATTTGANAVAATGTPLAASNSSLVQLGAAALANGSVKGTYLGLNAIAGFTGNFIDVELNSGASLFSVSSTGVVTGNGSGLTALNASNVSAGTLAVAQGGTGLGAVGNPGGVLGYTAAGTLASSVALPTGSLVLGAAASTPIPLPDVALGSVLVSGGVGAAPAYSANPSVTSITTTGAATIGGATTLNGAQTVHTNTQVGAAYAAAATDYIIFANPTAANMTVTLPAPAAGNIGQIYIVRRISTATKTLTVATGGGAFDVGNNTAVNVQVNGTNGGAFGNNCNGILVVSNGTNWIVLSQY